MKKRVCYKIHSWGSNWFCDMSLNELKSIRINNIGVNKIKKKKINLTIKSNVYTGVRH